MVPGKLREAGRRARVFAFYIFSPAWRRTKNVAEIGELGNNPEALFSNSNDVQSHCHGDPLKFQACAFQSYWGLKHAYKLVVESVAPLASVPVTQALTSSGHQKISLASIRHHVFAPSPLELEAIEADLKAATESLGFGYTPGRVPLCVALPATLAHLLLSRKLKDLILPRCLHIHPLAPDFPTASWLAKTEHSLGDGMDAVEGNFSHCRLRQALRQAQALVPLIAYDAVGAETLASLISWLRDLVVYFDPESSFETTGNRARSRAASTKTELFTALVATQLKNQSSLPKVMAMCSHLFHGVSPQACVSSKSVRRAQFRLDVATNIALAEESTLSPKVLWCWSDSSPVKFRNFFSTKVAEVPVSHLVEVAQAANRLSADCQNRRFDDSDLECSLFDRTKASQVLLQRRERVLPPVMLGAGCAGLDHKVAAMAYQMYGETLSVSRLQRHLVNIRIYEVGWRLQSYPEVPWETRPHFDTPAEVPSDGGSGWGHVLLGTSL